MALILGEDVSAPKRRTRRLPRDTAFDVRPYVGLCGQVVRCYREAANLSAEEVALEVGMTASPLNHFETGTGSLHLEKLLHVFQIVGIPIPFPFRPRVPPDVADIVDLFTRATPQMQAAVRAALEATDRYAPLVRHNACP